MSAERGGPTIRDYSWLRADLEGPAVGLLKATAALYAGWVIDVLGAYFLGIPELLPRGVLKDVLVLAFVVMMSTAAALSGIMWAALVLEVRSDRAYDRWRLKRCRE